MAAPATSSALLAPEARDYMESSLLPGLRLALQSASEAQPKNVVGFLAAGLTGENPSGWARPRVEDDVDAAFAAHFGPGAGDEPADGWLDAAARSALKSAVLDVGLARRVEEPLVAVGLRLETFAEDYQHEAGEMKDGAVPSRRARASAARGSATVLPGGGATPAGQLLRQDQGATIRVHRQQPNGEWAAHSVAWEPWHGVAKRQFALRNAVGLDPSKGFELRRSPADGEPIAQPLKHGTIASGEEVWLRPTDHVQPLRTASRRDRSAAPGGAARRREKTRGPSTMERLRQKKLRVAGAQTPGKSPSKTPLSRPASGASSPGQESARLVAQRKAAKQRRLQRKAASKQLGAAGGGEGKAAAKLTKKRKDKRRLRHAKTTGAIGGSTSGGKPRKGKGKAKVRARPLLRDVSRWAEVSHRCRCCLLQGKGRSFRGAKPPPPPSPSGPSPPPPDPEPEPEPQQSEEELRAQFPFFAYFDQDGDGTLGAAEVKAMMEMVGFGVVSTCHPRHPPHRI